MRRDGEEGVGESCGGGGRGGVKGGLWGGKGRPPREVASTSRVAVRAGGGRGGGGGAKGGGGGGGGGGVQVKMGAWLGKGKP